MSKEQKEVYVLDWYTGKNVCVGAISADIVFKAGDKIVYETTDQTGNTGLTVGLYLGHEVATDRKGVFKRILDGEEKQFFEDQQQAALKIFPLFKKLFKKYFPGSTPVTGRYHIFGDQLYFYFYSEERYVFSDFVKELRQILDKNIFLFQIGARDMIKMSPGTDCLVGCNGISLCCKSTRALPSVEIEALILQNLEGRDIEKLKGRCGKLKCCLIYELELYTQESKKYPSKGTRACNKSNKDQCGFVLSSNIISNEVTIKTDDGIIFRLPLDLVTAIKTTPTQ